MGYIASNEENGERNQAVKKFCSLKTEIDDEIGASMGYRSTYRLEIGAPIGLFIGSIQ